MEITSFGIRQRKASERGFLEQQAMLRVKVMLRIVSAIPLEKFGANFTKDISCEKIPNDDLCRLHCANTGILINQIKHSLLAA
jgi:hypothetical protein